MIGVTDRHCRYFHRLLAPRARLYTEMISTGALLHDDPARYLAFDESEHPVALQLGGSDRDDLVRCARLGAQWGYDEINLNCGCPSDRVQRGAFGAILMANAALVADAMKAMQDAVDVPVTVKHRLGLDDNEDYGFVRDFVGCLFDAGVRLFVVHARNAVLKGLSPHQNRQIPPLRYDVAARLAADFPDAGFVLNGGIAEPAVAQSLLERFDGVMLGRVAWHNPAVLARLHAALWPDDSLPGAQDVVDAMLDYAGRELARGTALRYVIKPMLGWASGRRGARAWRRTLSDAQLLARNDPALLRQAWDALCSGSDGQSRI